MRTSLKTTNFDHTPALDALAEEKLAAPVLKLIEAVDKEADIILEIEFELTTRHHRTGKIWRAEAQLELPHAPNLIRAEADGESLEEAVNIVKQTLLDDIKAYKERSREG